MVSQTGSRSLIAVLAVATAASALLTSIAKGLVEQEAIINVWVITLKPLVFFST